MPVQPRYLLEGASGVRYPESSLKELPKEWRDQAFVRSEIGCQLRKGFKENLELLEQGLTLRRFLLLGLPSLLKMFFYLLIIRIFHETPFQPHDSLFVLALLKVSPA